MIELHKHLKKWTDFSSSLTRPLSWMLIGPVLVLLNLLVSFPNFYDPVLPSLSILGFFLLWKWGLRGLSYLLLGFVFYLGFEFFFGKEGLGLWKFSWGCSFALAETITLFSMDELKKYYNNYQKEQKLVIDELKHSIHQQKEQLSIEKHGIEKERDVLQEKLQQSQKENVSLMQLTQSTQIETEKMYKQNEVLTKESLQQHRDLESLKLKLSQNKQELTELKELYQEESAENNRRLNILNMIRTERAQLELFFDAAQEDFQKFRKVILNLRQQVQKKPSGSATKPKLTKNKRSLESLEKDKLNVKKVYEQVHLDHQKLKDILGKVNAPEAQKIEAEMQSKKAELDKTKSHLVALEREIFSIKKEMQQQGLAT